MAIDIEVKRVVVNYGKGQLSQVAQAALVFSGGLLDGMRLEGFAIWRRPDGGYVVTFPSQMGQAGPGYVLLRPQPDAPAGVMAALRDAIVSRYGQEHSEREILPPGKVCVAEETGP
jgi:hypothetical protein